MVNYMSFIKLFVLCLVALTLGIVYYNAEGIIELTDIDVILPYIDYNKESFTQFHRHLATRLLQARDYIEEEKFLKALLEIRTVISLLDNRYQSTMLPNSFMVDKKNEDQNPIEDNLENLKFRFDANLLDYDIVRPKFKLSSDQIPESLKNLDELVTILIDSCSNEKGTEDNAQLLISQIRELWDTVKIVFVGDQAEIDDLHLESFKDVHVTGVSCDAWNSSALKTVLQNIETPFSLVLHRTFAVTSDLNITRLLNAMAEVKVVGVVGFAERGKDGGWDYTCSQLKLEGTHLDITSGYEYSKEACFFCDVTSNSFLADSNLLKEILPNFSLSFENRKLDWFLRLQELNVWTLTCPDVMVHGSNYLVDRIHLNERFYPSIYKDENGCGTDYENRKEEFKELAKEYNLTTITIQDNDKVKFIFENDSL